MKHIRNKCAMWHRVEMTIVFKGLSIYLLYIDGHKSERKLSSYNFTSVKSILKIYNSFKLVALKNWIYLKTEVFFFSIILLYIFTSEVVEMWTF